jgi:hypothetical protein
MRRFRVALVMACTGWCLSFGVASAADSDVAQLLSPEPALYWPDRLEVRAGGFAHCCFAESNSAAVGAEIIFPRLIRFTELPDFFSPRIHVGGVVDLKGHTSYGFAGLLFTHNFTQRIFAEAFVGVAVSNGVANGDATHNAIGCTTLIHSGGNLGYRFDQRWSVMLTLDHISNGNLCSRNLGVNNWGAKVGYTF